MKRKNVGAMSFNGGRNENFFFCLLEYFYEEDRWFLSALHQVRDEGEGEALAKDEDENIKKWIGDHNLQDLIVDFPLTNPPCVQCLPQCPGVGGCPRPEVKIIHEKIKDLLEKDQEKLRQDPKKYERERNAQDLLRKHSNPLEGERPLLSRPFKRKLKKGFLPYWNRPLDFWVWSEYYDEMLTFFNTSFDSFGNTSMRLVFRMTHLKRHLPSTLNFQESRVSLILLELLRSGVITEKTLVNLTSMENCAEDRLNIIHHLEKKLKVFIYDYDLEIIIKSPKAFNSFLLALAGQKYLLKETKTLPPWSLGGESRFIVPSFRP